MTERSDVCWPPFIPRLSGYTLDVDGTLCVGSEQGPPERRHWVVRGPKGSPLGSGRTLSAAVRVARLVLRERAAQEEQR